MNEILNNNPVIKNKIARQFGRAATYYDEHADVQREVARRLIASLEPWQDILPPGPILEVGCGTGFVTAGLANLYPDRKLIVTDLSSEMVETCKNKFRNYPNLLFEVLDAENPPAGERKYAMTISGFAAQWFRDPALTLGKWLEVTKPGGLLLAAFPGSESFPEWRRHCQELGIPFTGNTLPDTEEMVIKLSAGPAQVDYYEDTVTRKFASATDFFRHMKRLGAGTQQEGRHLTASEMKMLIRHWDDQSSDGIRVSYHVVFLAAKRDFNS